MGALHLIFCGFKTTLCSMDLHLRTILLYSASAKFTNKEFAKQKAAVGSVIKTNIEGIDREFKVSSENFLASIKVGDMFTHPLEVMKKLLV
jgi:hypothetical protein